MQLVNPVNNLNHVARYARGAHEAHDVATVEPIGLGLEAALSIAPEQAESVGNREPAAVKGTVAAGLEHHGVTGEGVSGEAVGAGPAVGQAAGVKRHHVIVPAVGLVNDALQAAAVALDKGDAGAAGPARVAKHGAGKGRVGCGHRGGELDDGEGDGAGVGGGVLPV